MVLLVVGAAVVFIVLGGVVFSLSAARGPPTPSQDPTPAEPIGELPPRLSGGAVTGPAVPPAPGAASPVASNTSPNRAHAPAQAAAPSRRGAEPVRRSTVPPPVPREVRPAAPSPSAPADLEKIAALARSGQLINAIKLFRESSTLGLKEAKEAVEALRDGRTPVTLGLRDGREPVDGAPPAPKHGEAGDAPGVERPVLDLETITSLARGGQLIAAIKLLRAGTELGLKEAKEAVEALRDGRPLPPGVLPGGEPEVQPPAPAEPARPSLDLERLAQLARGGQVIEAIKQYRAHTGVGLKEAKDAVMALLKETGGRHP